VYEHAKQEFRKMLKENAWHRAIFMDQCQECDGSN